jgi:hypothetical protein
MVEHCAAYGHLKYTARWDSDALCADRLLRMDIRKYCNDGCSICGGYRLITERNDHLNVLILYHEHGLPCDIETHVSVLWVFGGNAVECSLPYEFLIRVLRYFVFTVNT